MTAARRRPMGWIPTLLLLALGLQTGCGLLPSGGRAQQASTDPMTGTISGMVWEDICDPSPEVAVPDGCVLDETGQLRGNGVPDPIDPGMRRVRLVLWEGACPSAVAVAMRTAEEDGAYEFDGLAGGTYCLTIDPSAQDFEGLFGEGSWTHPASAAGELVASVTVTLAPGESVRGVSFAFDSID